MLHLLTRSIGKPAEPWQKQALSLYHARIQSLAQLSDNVYDCPKRVRNQNTKIIMAKERDLLLHDLPAQSHLIVLDERGRDLSTLALCQHLQQAQQHFSKLVFLIGGPDGHHPDVVKQSHLTLSLSRFTLPHMFAKIMLYEQLYRCLTLMSNHPYHRS